MNCASRLTLRPCPLRCAGCATYPVGLADFGAPPSSFAKFESTLAAAMHPTLSADPASTEWADQRILGERAGLVSPPVAVELMAKEFLDFVQQIEEPVDLTHPKYAAAVAAAAEINDQPHLAVYRAADGKITENDYSNSFRTAFQRVIRAPGAVINVDVGKPVGSGSSAASAIRAKSPRRKDRSTRVAAAATPPASPAGGSGTRASETNTDGTVSVDLGKYGKWIVLNLETKLHEIPSTQNDVYVWRHLPFKRGSSMLEIPTVLKQRLSNLPVILLDIYGGCILQVRMAAWAGPVLCSTIVATVPLRSAPGSASRKQLVGVLHALGVAIDSLFARYRHAAAAEAATLPATFTPVTLPPLHSIIPSDVLAYAAPDNCTLQLTGHIERLAFTGKLTRAGITTAAASSSGTSSSAAAPSTAAKPSAADFKRTIDIDPDTTLPVVVKFCRHYGTAVHLAVEKRGHAPYLLSCVRLGGWWMVVMEHLRQEDRWLHMDSAACPAVLAAYTTAFAPVEGGTPLVHGDVRMVNIFVRAAGSGPASSAASVSATTSSSAADGDTGAAASLDVKFIDFEFAGEEGAVRYPLQVTEDLFQPVSQMLPVGTQLGGTPILQAYDIALISAGELVMLQHGGGSLRCCAAHRLRLAAVCLLQVHPSGWRRRSLWHASCGLLCNACVPPRSAVDTNPSALRDAPCCMQSAKNHGLIALAKPYRKRQRASLQRRRC